MKKKISQQRKKPKKKTKKKIETCFLNTQKRKKMKLSLDKSFMQNVITGNIKGIKKNIEKGCDLFHIWGKKKESFVGELEFICFFFFFLKKVIHK